MHSLSGVKAVGLCQAVLLTLLIAAGLAAAPAHAQDDPPAITYTLYLPLLYASPASGLVIDHTCTDISQIPDYWLAEAGELTFHFAHTSHGSQIISGLEKLAELDSRYAVSIRAADPPALPGGSGLRIYDGNNYAGDNYITPEMFWETADGRSHTRSVADTDLFDYSMWAWCGQLSTYAGAQVDLYAGTLDQLESQYPEMRFVYMTGHADGDGGSSLLANNQLIKDYVNSNDQALFDFWDIDSYDPSGTYHDSNGDGQCLWCDTWCQAHPADCTDLPDSCAHSEGTQAQKLTCKLKAQAFWWMLARLAGWPGPS